MTAQPWETVPRKATDVDAIHVGGECRSQKKRKHLVIVPLSEVIVERPLVRWGWIDGICRTCMLALARHFNAAIDAYKEARKKGAPTIGHFVELRRKALAEEAEAKAALKAEFERAHLERLEARAAESKRRKEARAAERADRAKARAEKKKQREEARAAERAKKARERERHKKAKTKPKKSARVADEKTHARVRAGVTKAQGKAAAKKFDRAILRGEPERRARAKKKAAPSAEVRP